MEIVKFKEEISTLKRFFEVFCKEKHLDQQKIVKTFIYKDEKIKIELNMCPECFEKINYSFDRLLECSHEIKPRCRTCPTPCYGKQQWKETAKIMRYSGTRLGLRKIGKKLKNIFKKN